MTATTVLLIIVAALAALGLSFYQYLFRAKSRSKMHLFLAFLRTVTWFAVFLLLINPVITRKDLETVKTPLPILVDNSQSIKELGQDTLAKQLAERLASDKSLKDKYDVQQYTFAEGFESGKAPDFKGKQTHISLAADNLKQLYRNTTYPVVLLTDGNQTIGNDYVYSFTQNTSVYPLVVGDTATVLDLKVAQVNVNKYAFLKNKFPAEMFLQYNGNKTVNAVFSVMQGNSTLFKQNVQFSASKRAQAVQVLLDAEKVGVQTYSAVLTSAEPEKNRYNNTKNFAVEVIDQRSEVAIISAINHPDLGALKRSIETNQQRKVTVLKPNEVKSLQDYNVLILYQPNASFRTILEQNKNAGLNTFTITGLNTDFNLLNQNQDLLSFRMSTQKENYLTDFNSQFNLFALTDIGFAGFPPLENPFGTITVKGNANVLLNARVRNTATGAPLMVFSENGAKRSAMLLGENIWKWRMETHINTKTYEQFDIFMDKTIQFLASNTKRKSLVVNNESFYNSGEVISISAQAFNKNYEFEENARITIQLKNKQNNATKTYDFLKGSGEYKVNLDGLEAGQYSFTVKDAASNSTYAGNFEVLDFEIEKQFVNPDLPRLQQTAANTNGAVYYPDKVDELVKFLAQNDNYKAIQKEIIKKSPLIDWLWLLVILSVTLATEWFVRKYNGLL
ncbi:hypothetical protein AM493_07910 [Flavobacterium akiainvivens]|uniref:VWA domain-containing protein n=1 Tax=Flavobacterium akiainvivens TaxID=1202724 RepID=A0A0M9VHV5_9FLAO|nr:hypothetical protein [Flavobacterium akiainvivens]KOS05969.1 hypothetical protein AM493_07910 [Flavobacterium akiainvivens]SFQ53750.1 hypothetical protein SAMN05444144_10762 [Flavobacterium akiainvivens]